MQPDSNVVRLGGANAELRDRFLRWQCRVRQIAMRRHDGRPTSGMTPVVTVSDEPMARIVTVLSKRLEHSVTMELRHLARRTHDPAERRENALRLFAERHYQAATEFSDEITATFPPGSATAARLRDAGDCRLEFEQFGQRFLVQCTARLLSEHHPLREATFWHNLLFNPLLTADCTILGFAPDWGRSEFVG